MEGNENIAPEDVEYATGVAKDVKDWLLERYLETKLPSFKLPDCKEKFMKISERFLVMACQQLVEENFLQSDQSSRLPQFTISEYHLLPELKIPVAVEPVRRAPKRKVRKIIKHSEECSESQETEEYEECESDGDDDASDDQIASAVPKKIRVEEPQVPVKVIVHELFVNGDQQWFSAADPRLESVIALVLELRSEFGESFSFEVFAARAEAKLDMDLETFTRLAAELESANKIMRFDDEVIVI